MPILIALIVADWLTNIIIAAGAAGLLWPAIGTFLAFMLWQDLFRSWGIHI